ncbi:hypothetical protein STRTUCAR8_08303, partial [Streptomyces turgidiscabies Car8]
EPVSGNRSHLATPHASPARIAQHARPSSGAPLHPHVPYVPHDVRRTAYD